MPAQRRAPAPRHTSATSASCSPKATSRYFCLPASKCSSRHPSLNKPSVCFQNILYMLLAQTPAPWETRSPPTDLKHVARPLCSPVKTIIQEKLHLGSASISSAGHLTRYLSAIFTPGNVFLGKTQKVGNFGQQNIRAAGCSVLRGFGKMQEALRVLRQGKWLSAVPARKASPIIFVLPKANGTQGKAGGKSTERLAMAGQQPRRSVSPAEPPAARQSLHASLLAALFTSVRISHSPSPSRQARARVGRCQGNRSPGEDSLR